MPANFPLLRNEPLKDGQARALRTVLARETALQSHLELQRIEMENEASKAQDVVSSLVPCQVASERVDQALDALRAAIIESKDSISNAINVHATEAEAADKMATTTIPWNAWRDLIQLLETLTPQINETITSTRSHILNTSDQVCTYSFLAECTRDSIDTLNVSLDAIATSLSFKRRGLSSIFRIPNEVFEMIFQFAVEEEREQLRAEFLSSSSFSFDSLDDMKRTIPKCPFILAAVCRGWRHVALDTPKLWSYIRVYTSFGSTPIEGKQPTKYWVGKAAFEMSLQRAKGTPFELAIYQDPFKQIEGLPRIPPNAQISNIYLVRLLIVPQWLPSCSRLSLFGRGNTRTGWLGPLFSPQAIELPSFSTEPNVISCDNVRPIFLTPLDSTTAFSFRSNRSQQMPNLKQLSEKLPNLEILQLLLPDVSAPSLIPTNTTPITWTSLTTLRITSSVLPFLAADAQRGPSLPSLTTLILIDVFASFPPKERDYIKDVVKTVTSLEIHRISPSVKPSELRTLIDWMEGLHTVTLRLAPVKKTVEALSITPAKPIKRLVIEDTVLEEVELCDYTALLLDG